MSVENENRIKPIGIESEMKKSFIAYAMVAVGHCFTRTFFASSRSQNKAMPNGIPPFFYSLSLY